MIMKKFFVVLILIAFAVTYLSLNKGSVENLTEEETLPTSFKLGKRKVAGSFEHEQKGPLLKPQKIINIKKDLRSTQSPEKSNDDPEEIANDEKKTEVSQKKFRSQFPSNFSQVRPSPSVPQVKEPQYSPKNVPAALFPYSDKNKDTSSDSARETITISDPPKKDGAKSFLSGTVRPLIGQITSKSFADSFSAWATNFCTTPQVGIFKTADFLQVGIAPIQVTPLSEKAHFKFSPDPMIDESRPQDYIIQVLGCDTFLSRILTEFNDQQNIQLASTLISFSQVSPVNILPTNLSKIQLETITQKLIDQESNTDDILEIFHKLSSSSTATAFEKTFKGTSPDQLKNSLPIIREVFVPTEFSESTNSTLQVNANHWDPTYSLAAEWFINGVSKHFGPQWNWTPHANSQGNILITLRVGKKKLGLDEVDTSLPYHQLNFSRTVLNTVTPQVPLIEVRGTNPGLLNSIHIPLRILTGPGLINCDSFERMAITETSISPPIGSFNYICQSDFYQDLTYTLTSSNQNDGLKHLYLWTKDSSDEISSIPAVVSFELDQSAPIIKVSPISIAQGAGTTIDIEWFLTEDHSSSSQQFKVEFFNGSIWNDLPPIPLTNGPHLDTLFKTTYALPNISASNALFRITYADILGHTTSVLSNTFSIYQAGIIAVPDIVNFGDIPAKGQSIPRKIEFINNGAWSSEICSAPSLTGDSAHFNIISETCSGNTLAPSARCEVEVMAQPQERMALNGIITLACGTSSAHFLVSVTGDNNPPTLPNTFSLSTDEDEIKNFTLPPGVDIDGDGLVYFLVSGPQHGSLTNCLVGTSNLSCFYSPSLNYFGPDNFSYRAFDGKNYSEVQTVSITVNPINDPPTVPNSMALSLNEDTSLNFELNQGFDIEGSSLSYVIVVHPTNGSLSCTDRDCAYTPSANYFGPDQFSYKVNDGELDSNIATVTISVLPVNDPPVSPSDFSILLDEDTSKSFLAHSGTDIDNVSSELYYVIETYPSHGVLSSCFGAPAVLNCTYTPDLNYFGTDSFTYKTCDSEICSSNYTTVNFTVSTINDPPEMIADQVFHLNDTDILDFELLGATDIDNLTTELSYKLITAPPQGSLTGCVTSSWDKSLSCRFTPPNNFQGDISFTYQAYDGENQSLEVSTVTFHISDKTPSPIPNATLASNLYTNSTFIEITNSSCSDIHSLLVSDSNLFPPLSTSSQWVPCNTNSSGLNTIIPAVNGTHNLYVWSKDAYGNVQSSPASVSVIFDNIQPSISILSETVKGNGTSKVYFNVTETNASISNPFKVRYFNGTTWIDFNQTSDEGSLNNSSFSVDLQVPDANNLDITVEISLTDKAGNTGTQTANIKTDISLPILDKILVNDGASFSPNNNLKVGIDAHDEVSKVQYFCFKYNDSTPPPENSSCWKDVSAPIPGIPATQAISFNNYYFQVDFLKGTYTIYVWVKDSVGHISVNTGQLGIDKYIIDFDPGTPPEILALQVTNSDFSNTPVENSDLIIPSGGNVFVKWNAKDLEGLAANPISLEYSFDDNTYFPILGSQQLANSSNGGCTVDVGFTGCATFISPSNGYFRVRIIAKDTSGSTVFFNSVPLNDQRLKIIAGNTEHGIGASALAAIFYSYSKGNRAGYHYKNRLVVSEDGKFFYIDPTRGLLWIDPISGTLEKFIQTSGASTGDNGNRINATLAHPSAISLDHKNNLLIWDSNRVRMVDLSTMIIKTLYGGGNNYNPSVTANAEDVVLSGFDAIGGSIIPLPNGDILYSTNGSVRHHRYRASDKKIEPLFLTGQGISGYPTQNWGELYPRDFAVQFHPVTSTISNFFQGFVKSFVGDAYNIYVRISPNSGNETTPYEAMPPYDLYQMTTHSAYTGLDGKIYHIDRWRAQLLRFNSATGTSELILGVPGELGNGVCPNQTLATECRIDIESLFVNKNGRIYFMDQGVLRTINDQNRVISLYGQYLGYGDGELASVARFGNITDIKYWKDGLGKKRVVVLDAFSDKFREFEIDSKLEFLSTGATGMSGPWRFEIDKSNGDLLSPRHGNLYRFYRSLNDWGMIVGGGGTHYTVGDGLPGNQISYNSYNDATVGFINNKLYFDAHYWTGSYYTGFYFKEYDANDSYRQKTFLGASGNGAEIIQLGTPTASNYFTILSMEEFQDPQDGQNKIFFNRPGNQIYKAGGDGLLQHFQDLPRGFDSFTHRFGANGLELFYCSGGRLYQFNYSTQTETHLSWPSPTLWCKGTRTIIYNEDNNSIIFPFSQNALDGVAEYYLQN